MSGSATRLKPALNIFIGHAREDQPLVERIVRGLTFGGRVRVQTDRMLPVAEDWRTELRRALETTHVFIVIGSPASARSDFVLQELGGARALNKPIVVVTPEGEVKWAPPIEQSAYKRVALTELEQPAFAESLLTELTQDSVAESE
jgi:TIR domain-containing protein